MDSWVFPNILYVVELNCGFRCGGIPLRIPSPHQVGQVEAETAETASTKAMEKGRLPPPPQFGELGISGWIKDGDFHGENGIYL